MQASHAYAFGVHLWNTNRGQQAWALLHSALLSSTALRYFCVEALTTILWEEAQFPVQVQASDVYAVGVLLWEMYNGQRAWAGLHFAQVSYAMFVEKRSLQFPEGTPEGFRTLASHCLAPLPADRPSSKDLPAMLKQLVADPGEWKDAHSL